MKLEELIAALSDADPSYIAPEGFCNPHSFRGSYYDLAFEPAQNVTVQSMLDCAKSALGATYEGWKGGEFTMSEYTDCWICEEGTSDGAEPIGRASVLLLTGKHPQIQKMRSAMATMASCLQSIELHHVEQNDRKGRPHEKSLTLRLVRKALSAHAELDQPRLS